MLITDEVGQLRDMFLKYKRVCTTICNPYAALPYDNYELKFKVFCLNIELDIKWSNVNKYNNS